MIRHSLGRQIDEAAVQGYESKLVAPFRSTTPEVERKIVGDYCAQFFRELASGVWRQRTPKLYQYLAQK
ncbi:hypothetical protein [Variovorax sp. CF313]|uniref:hypothetical protein n=1 Tax=Variovorax sp. CF313 TaxID=1144315 RepID=UPI0012F8CBEF|nr:hypothetical protein [Variovorax sp. CF313]